MKRMLEIADAIELRTGSVVTGQLAASLAMTAIAEALIEQGHPKAALNLIVGTGKMTVRLLQASGVSDDEMKAVIEGARTDLEEMMGGALRSQA